MNARIVVTALALLSSACSVERRSPVAVWDGNEKGVAIHAEVRTGASRIKEWPDLLEVKIGDQSYSFVGLYRPDRNFITSPFGTIPDPISGAGDVFSIDRGRLLNQYFIHDKFTPGTALARTR